ncbi:hypothetical protein B0H16DRAFT_1898035 [Mycena metata]|uniref:Uncharacterized protein n=1 Tax=Mycena metata TaxID=1033252 RepID=A0AAD7HC01_9AGAR|nr:hypothetical protein B0H16DRAFT_1898035 [Mycena metata]
MALRYPPVRGCTKMPCAPVAATILQPSQPVYNIRVLFEYNWFVFDHTPPSPPQAAYLEPSVHAYNALAGSLSLLRILVLPFLTAPLGCLPVGALRSFASGQGWRMRCWSGVVLARSLCCLCTARARDAQGRAHSAHGVLRQRHRLENLDIPSFGLNPSHIFVRNITDVDMRTSETAPAVTGVGTFTHIRLQAVHLALEDGIDVDIKVRLIPSAQERAYHHIELLTVEIEVDVTESNHAIVLAVFEPIFHRR